MNIPPKDELKKKYGIANDDFDVLTEKPSQEKIDEKGILFTVESFSGIPTFLWKTWTGRVIAVIILYIFTPEFEQFAKAVTIFAASHFYSYVQTRVPEPHPTGLIAFLPQNTGISDAIRTLPLHQLPVGTGLFPASGQFQPV